MSGQPLPESSNPRTLFVPGPEAGHVQPVTVKAAPLQSEVKVRESEEYEYKIIRLSSASDEDDRMGPEEERTQRQGRRLPYFPHRRHHTELPSTTII